MYQVIYGYARPLQFLQEPKSLSCLGHNSVNMIVPLQRRIDHNAQQLEPVPSFVSDRTDGTSLFGPNYVAERGIWQ